MLYEDMDGVAELDNTDMIKFTPEGRLMVAIFASAMNDALSKHTTRLEKERAVSFLVRKQQDLRDVCLAVAGYDKEYVIRTLAQKLDVKTFFSMNDLMK